METAIWLAGGTMLISGAWSALLALRRQRGVRFVTSLTIAGCAGLVLLVLLGITHKRAQYDEFLQECTLHRPKYECVLLWRASARKDSSGDPLIIPIPTGR